MIELETVYPLHKGMVIDIAPLNDAQ